MISPSKYQQAIFDHIAKQQIGRQVGKAEDQAHAIIEAVAGSGKTTTIVEALKLTGPEQAVVFLAFNRSIAEELKRRVPAHVQARTFHSLCYSPVLRTVGARTVNGDKLTQVMKAVIPPAHLTIYSSFVRRMVGLARQVGLGALRESSEGAFFELMDHHDVVLEYDHASETQGIRYAQAVLEASNRSSEVDFDDLLYLSVLKGVKLPTFDWVFVDEAQDTNMIQRAVLRKILKKGGRLVAVGDRAQAIYGFRGADSDALDLLASEFSPCVKLPLSVTYRCPRAVVERAKTYVPEIEAREGAPEGEVTDRGSAWKLEELGPKDLVVCRTTRPLLDLGYRMLRARIPVRILGRDIGAGLISLVRQCSRNGGTLDSMLTALEGWREREYQKALAKGLEAKADGINDKAESIQILAQSLPESERSVESLIRVLEQLFTDDNSRCTLATIHKAKGLEADTVWWLAPSLCPSRWARRDWQQRQEQNIMYVATTRARQRLVLVELPEREKGGSGA